MSGVLIAVKPEVSRIKRHEEFMTGDRVGNQPGPDIALCMAGPWPAVVRSVSLLRQTEGDSVLMKV